MLRVRWQDEWPMWLVLAAMFALAAINWQAVPETIPVHWGLSGQPDRWGGRFEGLLLLPLIGVGLYLLLLLSPRIDPWRASYASFSQAYALLRLVVLLALAAIQVLLVLAARGRPVDMGAGVPLILGPLFVLLGSLFGKLRPNWFVGIRTPWTLSSGRAWDRTHHAGGRLFVLFGLLLSSVALVRARWYLIVVIGVIVTGVIGLVAYSYVQWKHDPDRSPPLRAGD